jgi:hypothetical protein
MKHFVLACAFSFLAGLDLARAQDFLDRADEALTISGFNDEARARLSGLADFEYYNFPQPPPGLIQSGGHDLFMPRLTLFLDANLGQHFYFFAQARLDSGFDPANRGAQMRLDEFALRYTPWSDGRFNLQLGKFATVVGTWVERHHSWENPFVTAPLPYETPTLVSDNGIRLTNEGARYLKGSDKYEFLPIIWGPVYAAGASVSGLAGIFEYAVELKDAPLASRPESWDGYDFERPAIDARLGLQPNEAWRFGVSAAEGNYLRDIGGPLPNDSGLSDDREFLIGQDVSYARGHLQFWAEAFEARFQVPGAGDADVFAYYLEAKYKFAPQLFGALRWNQELFGSGRDATGQPVARPPDIARVDLAAGYRFSAHTQLKLQYSLAHGDFDSNHLGSIFAAQFTIRF